MNKNFLIVVIVGFFIAIIVALAVNTTLSGGKSSVSAVNGAEMSMVLLAARDLRIGDELSDGDLKWSAWPKDAVFRGAIERSNEDDAPLDMVSGRLNQPLNAGQPVLRDYLVNESQGNFMAASLAPGMRAMGISVKAETMAGGFIGPGDYVDVILTHKVRIRDRDNRAVSTMISEYATETVLESVRILAVDQTSKRDEDKAKVARTVTLEVDSRGAEKMAIASEMGDITLVLRSLGDDKKVAGENMTTDVEVSPILKNVTRLEASSGSSSSIVRVYNGNDVVNVPIRKNIETQQGSK